MDKKASDVILELQEQIKSLQKTIVNMDSNIKLILKRLNNISSVQNTQQKIENEIQDTIVVQASTNKIETLFVDGQNALDLKYKHAQEQNKNSNFEKLLEEYGLDSDDESVNPSQKLDEATQQRRGSRVPVQQNAKERNISVSQQLLDSDNKPLTLATVKIIDSNGNIVKSARSNTKGKWIMPLIPGNYTIHVMKKFIVEDKKPVETKYSLTVPSSNNGVFEAPSIIIGKI